MRVWPSLKYKLPLLISALLGAVVIAVCWVGYDQLEDLLIQTARSRLTSSTQQLTDLFEDSIWRTRRNTRWLAADAAVAAFVARPADDTQQRARQVLEGAQADATRPTAFVLWSRSWTPLLTVGPLPAAEVGAGGPAALNLSRGRALGGAWVGPLTRSEGGAYYPVVAPVLGADRDTLGFLAAYRRLAAGEGATQVGGLIGPGASLLIGNAAGDAWITLSRPSVASAAFTPDDAAPEHIAPDDPRLLGVVMPIPSTPWRVWVSLSRRTALEPATHFVSTIVGIAAVFIALGTLVGWFLSRQVTAPLVEISGAAEDIARGDYARRVPDTRRDELGSLARSFNSMAAQVEAASRELQAHAGDLELANEELRESERRYRQLVEILPDAVIVHRDGRITFANPATVRLFGAASAEELNGRSVLDFFAPDDRPELEARVRAAQHERRVLPVIERTVCRLDGSTRHVEGASTPFTFDGQPVALTILRDITERRRLEDRVRQAQKMEAVGQLAGGVAHDFNNLLTVITSYSGMLLGELPPDDPVRDDVREIASAADRAAALTRQLLAFSRQQMLQPRVVDPNQVITDMERMLRRVLPADIRLVTRLDPALGRVCVDPGQLEQVVMNLAVNARDAMADGGTLVIETANVELTEDEAPLHPAAAAGPYVTITVTDTGIGMTEEVRAHMFEPFFTTKEAGRGTGLGLATVYGIVTQSGGHVWVYSEPGQGTVFKVYLPRVEAPASQRPSAEVAAVRDGARATILLAEDEAPVRAVARRILERAGYSVLEAANGSEGLRLCREHAPRIDLLLTDMMMPDMRGPELAARFRELCPEAPTVFMSGYTEDTALRQDLGTRGAWFIQKPFAPQQLTQTVREALEGAATPDPG